MISREPHFNGPDYDPELDHDRLMTQLERIRDLMLDGRWRTLREIAQTTNDPESSISAQLRHLRKVRFGSYILNKRSRGQRERGLYEYQLLPPGSPAEKDGEEMRHFIQEGKLHPLIWSVGIDKNDPTVVMYQNGVLGGAMKRGVDRPGPVGKNSAEIQALEVVRRLIDEKVKRHGYREVSEEELELIKKGEKRRAKGIDFKDPPGSTSFWKCQQMPQTGSKSEKKMLEVITAERAIFTVKRDGLNHPIFIDEKGEVHIFTRRMDRCTEWYPHLVDAVKKSKFPPRTIALAELVIAEKGIDKRLKIQSLSRSLPARSRELQQNPFMRPTAVVLCFPYWAGEPIMEQMPVQEWLIHSFNTMTKRQGPYLEPIQLMPGHDFTWAKNWIVEKGHEGLVLYDGEACFGSKVVNFRGTPERPDSVWKWKPVYEDDFIVVFNPDRKFGGKWGRGSRMKGPGAVALYQYNKDGYLVYRCDCGSGFTEQTLKEIMVRSGANTGQSQSGGICGVARVQFTRQSFIAEGDESNALEFPIFLEWHPDKIVHEVVESRLGGGVSAFSSE